MSAKTVDLAISDKQSGKLTVKSTGSGRVSLKRQGKPLKDDLFGEIRISGFTGPEAVAKSKGFWSRLWSAIKSVFGKVKDVITWDWGGASCRLDIKKTKGGFTIGFTCTN